MCTLVLARRAFRLPSYGLPFVTDACRFEFDNNHNPLANARAVVRDVRSMAGTKASSTWTNLLLPTTFGSATYRPISTAEACAPEATAGSPESVALAEQVEQLIQTVAPGISLKYNRHYIGLARGGKPDNFVIFWARRDHLIGGFKIRRSDEMTAPIEESGFEPLEYGRRGGRYRIRLTDTDISKRRDALLELIRRAHGTPAADEGASA